MISTLTEKGAEVTLEALTLGAVDFIAKPKVDVISTLNGYADEIIGKVKMAAIANIRSIDNRTLTTRKADKTPIEAQFKAGSVKKPGANRHKIIGLGASTGGTEAIKAIVKTLPADTPAMVIVQHLPAAFSESFVRHIDMVSAMTASIPKHGQTVEQGHIYLAPGDRHMAVIKEGSRYVIQLYDSELVNRHKPAADVLFRSLALHAGANAIAVLLTGMGADGALGMKEMHDAGAKTVIQDEPSSVVWGMPGAAFKLGCTDYVLPLEDVADKILALAK
jgi:two-component system chemotaxis response regulator CheB